MSLINKSEGTTISERYLAKLADRTFLNLWAYPNVYRDVIVNGKKSGKELCDLLVVCGDHVIIFSDKNIKWPTNLDTKTAWIRWYKKAIQKSVKQLRGAESWILKNPDRIFLNVECTQRLPIKLPPAEKIKIYNVAVALGAHKACSRFFNGDRGSFMVRPSIVDGAHFDPTSSEFSPFVIGDVDSRGSYIHVLNDITLDVLMRELDTITDFTEYLEKRAKFSRSGNLGYATGEEDMLAYYLTRLLKDGTHGFAHPKNSFWRENDIIAIDGNYSSLLNNPQYIDKKEADKVSYVWDSLIKVFTSPMLKGETLSYGAPFKLSDHELGVRYMALEPRLMRRMLGKGVFDVLESSHYKPRNFRCMAPGPDSLNKETAYGLLLLAHPEKKLDGGYEQYRRTRINLLAAYCRGILYRYRHLKRVIGIAVEPPGSLEKGFSEDMVFAEQPKWTPEIEKEVKDSLESFGIMKEGNFQEGKVGIDEYPKTGEDGVTMPNPYKTMIQKKESQPIRRLKIGRNDSCPCLSGKKYKKCGLLDTPEHQAGMAKLTTEP